jgi:hypothetical protein
MLKELDMREADGISVVLLWDTQSVHDDSITPLLVRVEDRKTSTSFEIACDTGAEGLHAFHHPYAARDTAATGKVAA